MALTAHAQLASIRTPVRATGPVNVAAIAIKAAARPVPHTVIPAQKKATLPASN